jgi:ferredoxin
VTGRRLAVDWPACKAHGVCAELLPEIVELDEWGYPVIAPGAVPESLRRYAQRAVSSCPTLALRLVPLPEEPARGPAASTASTPAATRRGERPAVTPTQDSPRRRARRSS